jgi:hypothetical protein
MLLPGRCPAGMVTVEGVSGHHPIGVSPPTLGKG